tara:strand:- start:200 stop:304 length:105 start_codon:yes stop_codon:yes gene_type:complete
MVQNRRETAMAEQIDKLTEKVEEVDKRTNLFLER